MSSSDVTESVQATFSNSKKDGAKTTALAEYSDDHGSFVVTNGLPPAQICASPSGVSVDHAVVRDGTDWRSVRIDADGGTVTKSSKADSEAAVLRLAAKVGLARMAKMKSENPGLTAWITKTCNGGITGVSDDDVSLYEREGSTDVPYHVISTGGIRVRAGVFGVEVAGKIVSSKANWTCVKVISGSVYVDDELVTLSGASEATGASKKRKRVTPRDSANQVKGMATRGRPKKARRSPRSIDNTDDKDAKSDGAARAVTRSTKAELATQLSEAVKQSVLDSVNGDRLDEAEDSLRLLRALQTSSSLNAH